MLALFFLALPWMANAAWSSSGSSSASHEKSKFTATDKNVLMAHGIVAALAWVFFIPVGAIAFRLLHGRKAFWVHGAIQTIGLIAFWCAAGMGIFVAKIFNSMSKTHELIGLVILALSGIQPIIGITHHVIFVRRGPQSRSDASGAPINASPDAYLSPSSSEERVGVVSYPTTAMTTDPVHPAFAKEDPRIAVRSRIARAAAPPSPVRRGTSSMLLRLTTVWGFIHRYIGRALIILAAVNAGLGLKDSRSATHTEKVAYSVVAAVIVGIYLAVVVFTGPSRRGVAKRNHTATRTPVNTTTTTTTIRSAPARPQRPSEKESGAGFPGIKM